MLPAAPKGIESTPEEREFAKSLYSQGLPIDEIAQRLSRSPGTIRNWSSEGKWHLAVEERSEQAYHKWLAANEASIQEATKHFNTFNVNSIEDLKNLEAARSSHVATGRKLFGIDDKQANSGPTTLVQVNSLGPTSVTSARLARNAKNTTKNFIDKADTPPVD